MKIAPHPLNESDRIAVLHRYDILDVPSDSVLDSIAHTAADMCGTPIVLISLIDSTRQWFKSRIGLPVQETPRDMAFCTHAILEPDELMEIEDATLDERFCDNPLVTGDPKIRFYAGMPLVTPDGFALGTLCVIDTKPQKLSGSQKKSLQRLARVVMDLLNERTATRGSANDDQFGQSALYSVQIASPNGLSANSPMFNTNNLTELSRIRRNRLWDQNDRVVDTLSSIVFSAIEYDKHISRKKLVNFMYFYCAYLKSTRPLSVSINDKLVDLKKVPATFLEFISDQTLLNETASFIEYEEGELITAPTALDNRTR